MGTVMGTEALGRGADEACARGSWTVSSATVGAVGLGVGDGCRTLASAMDVDDSIAALGKAAVVERSETLVTWGLVVRACEVDWGRLDVPVVWR